MAHRFRWNGVAVGDVGELQDPTGAQHTPHLAEHGLLVCAEVEHPVGDYYVGPAVFDGHLLGEALPEGDVVEPELFSGSTRLGEHLGGHVDADDLALRADLAGGDEAVEPRPGADVDDPLTGVQRSKAEWVGDASERLDGRVGEVIDDRVVVAETGGMSGLCRSTDSIRCQRVDVSDHDSDCQASTRPV